MKDFWKMLLAVVCGMLVFIFALVFIFSSAFSASMASEGKNVVLPRSGVLAIDMSAFSFSEQEKPIPAFQGTNTIPSLSLFKSVQAIKLAAQDPGVKFIFLRTDGNLSDAASIEELRKALAEFRQLSGKPVVAYIESPSTSSYWLASVADKVYMTTYQGSTITMLGANTQGIYLKDLLDRLGVNVQLIRHGKYKSAGEMFIRNSSSAENTYQNKAMVNSMWSTIRADIAVSRGIAEAAVDAAVDDLRLCLPEDFIKEHFADATVTRDELKEKLASVAVASSFDDVKFIPFPDYVAVKVRPNYKAKSKIAVIFAQGNIVDGRATEGVAGDRFASVIDKVRADSTIKAVVLRVNSPGGSVLASEKIKHELDLLGQEKPLIASYGTYAASGGYWISNNCDKIFSDALTLTGSIGVFGMIPDFSKTAKNVLNIGVETVSSNKHGGMYSLMRPLDSAEYAYMQRSIEAIYDKFTTIVAEGRELPKARVDEIGQGRVWTGADALGIGLVDEIGTLSDAVSYAASAAGIELEDSMIKEFPEPLTVMQQMMLMLGSQNPEQEFVKSLSKPQVIARMPYQITLL